MGTLTSEEAGTIDRSHWTLQIDEVDFQADSLGILVNALKNESNGERRPEVLANLLLQITQVLNLTSDETPQALTDLLRDLSLEHDDAMVRFSAYEAMLTSLKTEYNPFQPDLNIVQN